MPAAPATSQRSTTSLRHKAASGALATIDLAVVSSCCNLFIFSFVHSQFYILHSQLPGSPLSTGERGEGAITRGNPSFIDNSLRATFFLADSLPPPDVPYVPVSHSIECVADHFHLNGEFIHVSSPVLEEDHHPHQFLAPSAQAELRSRSTRRSITARSHRHLLGRHALGLRR